MVPWDTKQVEQPLGWAVEHALSGCLAYLPTAVYSQTVCVVNANA